MRIGELARLSGVKPSAIRYYEKAGILEPPSRVAGQRRYPMEAVYRVLLVRFAGSMGFTLEESTLFLRGLGANVAVGPRWPKLAARKLREIEESMERFRQLKRCWSICFGAVVLRSESASSGFN